MEVSLLIQQSYRDANLVAETGETADADQLNTGVLLLNRIIKRISLDGFDIPLISEESFTLTSGSETLDLPGWVELSKVEYFLGDVLVDIKLADLNTYYNNAALRNAPGPPYIAYPKRTPTGILLRMFLPPNEAYEIFIRGYKQIDTVLVNDAIDPNTIAGFMEDYLGYLLALDLQINAQIDKPSPYLVMHINRYEAAYKNLKFMRIDKLVNKMGGDHAGGTKSIIGYGVSQGWTY